MNNIVARARAKGLVIDAFSLNEVPNRSDADLTPDHGHWRVLRYRAGDKQDARELAIVVNMDRWKVKGYKLHDISHLNQKGGDRYLLSAELVSKVDGKTTIDVDGTHLLQNQNPPRRKQTGINSVQKVINIANSHPDSNHTFVLGDFNIGRMRFPMTLFNKDGFVSSQQVVKTPDWFTGLKGRHGMVDYVLDEKDSPFVPVEQIGIAGNSDHKAVLVSYSEE